MRAARPNRQPEMFPPENAEKKNLTREAEERARAQLCELILALLREIGTKSENEEMINGR
jgi:hypothetical protein